MPAFRDLAMHWVRFAPHVALALTAAAASAATTSGPPTVNANVVNTPSVIIANPAPVPVTLSGAAVNVQTAQIPYSVDSVGTCGDVNCFVNFPVVPAGKTLVITFVSSQARTNAPAVFEQLEMVTSNTQNANFGVRITLGFNKIGSAGLANIYDTYAANGNVLAFVNAGSFARMTLASRNGGLQLGFVQGTISGYLIPAQ